MTGNIRLERYVGACKNAHCSTRIMKLRGSTGYCAHCWAAMPRSFTCRRCKKHVTARNDSKATYCRSCAASLQRRGGLKGTRARVRGLREPAPRQTRDLPSTCREGHDLEFFTDWQIGLTYQSCPCGTAWVRRVHATGMPTGRARAQRRS